MKTIQAEHANAEVLAPHNVRNANVMSMLNSTHAENVYTAIRSHRWTFFHQILDGSDVGNLFMALRHVVKRSQTGQLNRCDRKHKL